MQYMKNHTMKMIICSESMWVTTEVYPQHWMMQEDIGEMGPEKA